MGRPPEEAVIRIVNGEMEPNTEILGPILKFGLIKLEASFSQEMFWRAIG